MTRNVGEPGPQGKSLTLYWSETGNTAKVGRTIHSTLTRAGLRDDLVRIDDSCCVEYLHYNLVFVGFPVYGNLPPPPVIRFLEREKKRGVEILPCAPEQPGIGAVVFCTFAGGHTGVNEAVPALKFAGQFLEHEGIRVIDEWAIPGSFPRAGRAYNVAGRCGVVLGRPNRQDLQGVAGNVKGLLVRMSRVLPLRPRACPG
jgi:hypothetical protein